MQPGRRIVAGSGDQTTYVGVSGQPQPVQQRREGALAAEALELQRQQHAAARTCVTIVTTVTTQVLPPARAPLGGRISGAVSYYAPVHAPASHERADLNGRVKKPK